jgi:tripartite-type tricarboxylate transporter receptor subunit TctC
MTMKSEMSRRAAFALLAAMALALAEGGVARAQDYPTRLIKLVVGYPPGGPIDTTARILVPRLAAILGQTVIVENRPGATGTLAGKNLVATEPDGYTIMLGNASSLAVMPAITHYRDYDATRSFAPIAKLTEGYEVLVVAPDGPKSVQELIAQARANPGKLNFGSAGFGNLTHLSGELLKLRTGIDIVHIPYKGAPEAQTALLAGQIHMMFGEVAGLLPMVRAGKLRALGVASERRNALAPELPTLIEGGLPDFVALTFTGIVAPAATPPAIVARLSGAIDKALAEPEVRVALERLGSEVRPGAPADFAAFLAKEKTKWDEVVRQSGVTMN